MSGRARGERASHAPAGPDGRRESPWLASSLVLSWGRGEAPARGRGPESSSDLGVFEHLRASEVDLGGDRPCPPRRRGAKGGVVPQRTSHWVRTRPGEAQGGDPPRGVSPSEPPQGRRRARARGLGGRPVWAVGDLGAPPRWRDPAGGSVSQRATPLYSDAPGRGIWGGPGEGIGGRAAVVYRGSQRTTPPCEGAPARGSGRSPR